MQYDVIELVVAVDDAAAACRCMPPYVCYYLVKVRVSAAECRAGGNVADGGLLGFDAREGGAVAGVEVFFFAKGGEADGRGGDGVEPG